MFSLFVFASFVASCLLSVFYFYIGTFYSQIFLFITMICGIIWFIKIRVSFVNHQWSQRGFFVKSLFFLPLLVAILFLIFLLLLGLPLLTLKDVSLWTKSMMIVFMGFLFFIIVMQMKIKQ